jgi:hypothetical protein
LRVMRSPQRDRCAVGMGGHLSSSTSISRAHVSRKSRDTIPRN